MDLYLLSFPVGSSTPFVRHRVYRVLRTEGCSLARLVVLYLLRVYVYISASAPVIHLARRPSSALNHCDADVQKTRQNQNHRF